MLWLHLLMDGCKWSAIFIHVTGWTELPPQAAMLEENLKMFVCLFVSLRLINYSRKLPNCVLS